MNLSALLLLKRSPISLLDFPFRIISDALAQVGPNLFLGLAKYDANLSVLSEREASHIIWSASLGAVQRVRNFEIEADELISAIPPVELTFGIPLDYERLLSHCKEVWPSSTLETASYRIASDGKFICRNIQTPVFSFHFRSHEHDLTEAPFVIQCKLAQKVI